MRTMTWERAEDWPGEATPGTGAFRAAARPTLAKRERPSPAERVRLWLRSTPDHPYRAMPGRVAVTGVCDLYFTLLYFSTREVPGKF